MRERERERERERYRETERERERKGRVKKGVTLIVDRLTKDDRMSREGGKERGRGGDRGGKRKGGRRDEKIITVKRGKGGGLECGKGDKGEGGVLLLSITSSP